MGRSGERRPARSAAKGIHVVIGLRYRHEDASAQEIPTCRPKQDGDVGGSIDLEGGDLPVSLRARGEHRDVLEIKSGRRRGAQRIANSNTTEKLTKISRLMCKRGRWGDGAQCHQRTANDASPQRTHTPLRLTASAEGRDFL